MGKSKHVLSAPTKAIDPALDALFSQSAGAVKTPPKSRYAELLPTKPTSNPEVDEVEEADEGGEDEEDTSDNQELEDSDANSDTESAAASSDVAGDASSGDHESGPEDTTDVSSMDQEAEAAEVVERMSSRGKTSDEGRKRKRKRGHDDEDLEANYLERLAKDEEPTGKRRKADGATARAAGERVGGSADDDDEGNKAGKAEDDGSGDEAPVHESLSGGQVASELEKAHRTVFLSNVSVEAITSRKAKKTLLKHLSSVLDKNADPPQEVQSIRFRSTAFATAGIPKRAAYIKKSVMEATTKSTNAYVVYSTNAAARLAVAQLNGSIVLDRHLRVDSVAHPAPVDHRRCVFVGNLGFVDDESVYNVQVDEEGKEVTEKRKRTKAPMDVEEGLWRVFGEKAGKVESVRVVRDAATRVGKGFAYVQFYDGNSVEAAILLNGKKFPPMLPRELRVSRCKAPHKTARAMEARRDKTAISSASSGKGKKHADETAQYVPKPTAEAQTLAGRASKLLGRFGAAHLVGSPSGKDKKEERSRDGRDRGSRSAAGTTGGENRIKAPEQFVFEGRRASARDGKPRDLKFKTKSKSKAKDKAHMKKKKKQRAGKAGK